MVKESQKFGSIRPVYGDSGRKQEREKEREREESNVRAWSPFGITI